MSEQGPFQSRLLAPCLLVPSHLSAAGYMIKEYCSPEIRSILIFIYFISLNCTKNTHTWLCIYSNTSQKVHSLVGLHVKHRHTNTYAHFNTCITTHTMCARVHTLLISHKHVRLRRGAPDAFQSPCLGTTSLDTQQS